MSDGNQAWPPTLIDEDSESVGMFKVICSGTLSAGKLRQKGGRQKQSVPRHRANKANMETMTRNKPPCQANWWAKKKLQLPLQEDQPGVCS